MKKKDFILASAMIIVALVWFLITTFNKEDGNTVTVIKDNEIIDAHSITDSGEYSIYDGDTVIMKYCINDGMVDVTFADCKDQICVHQRPVSMDEDVIVCLPNSIVIEVSGQAKSSSDGYDVVVY